MTFAFERRLTCPSWSVEPIFLARQMIYRKRRESGARRKAKRRSASVEFKSFGAYKDHRIWPEQEPSKLETEIYVGKNGVQGGLFQ